MTDITDPYNPPKFWRGKQVKCMKLIHAHSFINQYGTPTYTPEEQFDFSDLLLGITEGYGPNQRTANKIRILHIDIVAKPTTTLNTLTPTLNFIDNEPCQIRTSLDYIEEFDPYATGTTAEDYPLSLYYKDNQPLYIDPTNWTSYDTLDRPDRRSFITTFPNDEWQFDLKRIWVHYATLPKRMLYPWMQTQISTRTDTYTKTAETAITTSKPLETLSTTFAGNLVTDNLVTGGIVPQLITPNVALPYQQVDTGGILYTGIPGTSAMITGNLNTGRSATGILGSINTATSGVTTSTTIPIRTDTTTSPLRTDTVAIGAQSSTTLPSDAPNYPVWFTTNRKIYKFSRELDVTAQYAPSTSSPLTNRATSALILSTLFDHPPNYGETYSVSYSVRICFVDE